MGRRVLARINEKVRAGSSSSPPDHPWNHDRTVATAIRIVRRTRDAARFAFVCELRWTRAQLRVRSHARADAALEQKARLGAVELALGSARILPRHAHYLLDRALCEIRAELDTDVTLPKRTLAPGQLT